MFFVRRFLREEDGVVTIEWVALGAGVVVLALGIVIALDPAIGAVVVGIADTIGQVSSDLADKAVNG
ncbi:hypothetical protein M1105_05795 [Limibaculum sp. FT325]|uniref:Flp family type IVb pilin n=1 Tax=Thermohalobaculum sediminis TaxID=2939436 RepID=UPI0020C0DC71|nr:hypothetical protein [Limibaculum sediminis]MCL5776499.1 hypothetical protein [Limibaculum sediminis]